jgi:hypothetical protein
MKQEEERRLKLISQLEARSPKIHLDASDPWAYNDQSDDDDVVVQKEVGIEMVGALRESNTIDHSMKGLNNPAEILLGEAQPKAS